MTLLPRHVRMLLPCRGDSQGLSEGRGKQDGEVGGVDTDFDHLFTAYHDLLTFSLLDGLVAVVADTIKTTTPLEVEASDVAVTEEPSIAGEASAFQLEASEELV